MGHPSSSITFGIPFASSDGRFYSRYPQGNAIGTPGNASGASASASVSAPAAVAMVPLPYLYADGFESFTVGANLSGTAMHWAPDSSGVVVVSNVSPRSGTKCIDFRFFATPRLTELRFDLGANYREVTLEYYVRLPSNYEHRNGPSTDNNKFFRLWPSNPADYDSMEKLGCSTELGDTMFAEWDDGLIFPNGIPEGFTQQQGTESPFWSSADFNVYRKIKWYCKAATAKGGAGRAVMQLWKDDELVLDTRPDIFTTGQGNPHSFRYGYLFGAANSGWNVDTTIKLDDIVVTVVA